MEEAGNRNTCLTLSMKEDFLGVDSTLTGAAGSETEVCLDAISALVDVTGSRTEKCLGAISALANAICSKLEDLLGAVSALADATLMEMTSSVLITELGNTSLADTSVTGITPGFLTGIISNGINPSSLGFFSKLVIFCPTLLCTPPTETVDNE